MPFANIEGRQLHFTDYPASANPDNALPIVLVHGLGSTQNYYGPILPYLSQFRCVTFDNYGAGRSKFHPELYPDTSIDQIGRDVLGLMDHLSISKAVIVGYSMGGMVPTTVAASKKGKDRVIAAVCIGPVHPTPEVAQIFAQRVPNVMQNGIEVMANSVPSAATGPNTTQLQKSFIREMIMAQDPKGYCLNCRAIETATPPDYASVECPIYIIGGSVDKSAPASGCQLIHDSLANARERKIDIIKDMGHWYCVEDPDIMGKLVGGWCSKFA